MFYTKREKPNSLLILRSLNSRQNLEKYYKNYYKALVKGWEGECAFDSILEKTTHNSLILRDLVFNVNRTTIQIDTLVITENKLYLYEIKNYEGDYTMEGDVIRKISTQFEYINPIFQLKRSKILMKQLLRQLKIRLPLEDYVTYVNSQFTLFNADSHSPILLPTMIEEHMSQLNKHKTSLTNKHTTIAKKLCDATVSNVSYDDLPDYTFKNLQKGLVCFQCDSSIHSLTKKMCLCSHCGYKELASKSIYRHIQEYVRLFPDRKITTKAIQEWCGFISSKERIRPVLNKHFKSSGVRRGKFYY